MKFVSSSISFVYYVPPILILYFGYVNRHFYFLSHLWIMNFDGETLMLLENGKWWLFGRWNGWYSGWTNLYLIFKCCKGKIEMNAIIYFNKFVIFFSFFLSLWKIHYDLKIEQQQTKKKSSLQKIYIFLAVKIIIFHLFQRGKS